MQQRRTRTGRGEVFPRLVSGMCGRRVDRQARRRADPRRRTRQDCGTVFQTPAPARSFSDGMCLACDERIERGRRVTLFPMERSCQRCLMQLFPLTVWASTSEHEDVKPGSTCCRSRTP
ncbi:hypothetical protein J2Z21_008679 [Streptomyces griseochromogenes]|uniref:Uncharacterized protein n=1 Tax=Streptomyces griseochromogenes TaxID=68214 RepID=A0A1B1B0A3_9ACTN|nr:hypothetical protein [Streptomyces griseochromogenes]ANP52237.1 hypothetical protein AVL59_24185 [Streptomyces griseochromogenes]MBP2055663.1 hypothetical protein [Streptomyces griseochromogenes]